MDSMTISFAGQAVVITGAGGGLGRAFALEIARLGGMVVVNDLGGPVSGEGGEASRKFADDVVNDIRAAGGTAVANYDSVATPEGGRAIIQAALDHFGRLDAVIANAGTIRYGPFETMGLDDLNALLAVHVGGSWNVAQAAWPVFKAQAGGRMVFVTSSAAALGNSFLSAYGAAKGGVMGLMHALAEAGAPHGILCNAIMPNAMSRMTMGITAEDLGENKWAGALGQYFDPAYTAGLVVYLASRACTTHHGIYSALGGRIGRAFIGIADGLVDDRVLSADTIAAHWALINDATRGYTIPANNSDEFRIVAEQRGVTL
jgi:NAD(P)-dependent dehydrogenase (short-subunit alcohol dehydrogenase family)